MDLIDVDQSEWNLFTSRGKEATSFSNRVSTFDGGIEIRGLSLIGIQYQHLSQFRQVQFRDCHFKHTFTISHGGSWNIGPVQIDFVSCNFEQFKIEGANVNLSIDIQEFSNLNSFEVVGYIRSVNINNENDSELKLVKRISVTDKGNDVRTEVSVSGFDCETLLLDRCENLFFDGKKINSTDVKCTSNVNVGIEFKNSVLDKISLKAFSGHFAAHETDSLSIFITGLDNDARPNIFINQCRIGRFELLSKLKFEHVSFEQSKLGILALGELEVKDLIVNGCEINWMIIPLKTLYFDNLEISGNTNNSLHINYLSFLRGSLEQLPDSKIKPKIILEQLSVFCLEFISFHNNSYFLASDVKQANVSSVAIPANSPTQPSSEYLELMAKRNVDVRLITTTFSLIRIVQSDLGKINFISCDFSDMRMLFAASKITDVFLSGSEFPKVLTGPPRQRQVGFSQIKKIYEARGDSVRSMDFLSLELNAHYEDIKENRTHPRRWVEKATLWLNKNTNNFGTDWSSVFPWVLYASVPLFIAYMASLGISPEVLSPGGNQLSKFFVVTSYFLEFFSPIHKADFISDDLSIKTNALSRTIDFIGRLVNGYLIYQFIQAFRKFGKK